MLAVVLPRWWGALVGSTGPRPLGRTAEFSLGELMREYRLYCLNGDGHIDLAEWIEASDDVDAVTKARQMKARSKRCEVWDRKRLIATLTMQDLEC